MSNYKYVSFYFQLADQKTKIYPNKFDIVNIDYSVNEYKSAEEAS